MIGTVLVMLALLVAQDSTAVAPPGVNDVALAAAAALGLLSSLALGGVKKTVDTVATKVRGVDTKVSKFVGPAYPLVTLGLAVVLPKLGNAIGVTDIPDAAIFANAPVASIIGIAAREAVKRWILPKVRTS